MMRKTTLILLGAAAGIALTLISTQPRIVFDGSSARAATADTYRQLSLFGDVFERVRADYVEKPDDSKLIIQQLSEEFEFDKLKKQLAILGEKCKQMLMAWAEGFSDKEICIMLDYNSPQVAKTSRLRCLEKLKENYLK